MQVISRIDEITRRVTGVVFESSSFEEERILGTILEAICNERKFVIVDKEGNLISEFAFGDFSQET